MKHLIPVWLVLACGTQRPATPDAIAIVPCCELGADAAPACVAAEIPVGTCAIVSCGDHRIEACSPKPCRCAPASLDVICDCTP